MNRRQYLTGLLVGSVTTIAGCTSGSGDETETATATSSGTPDQTLTDSATGTESPTDSSTPTATDSPTPTDSPTTTPTDSTGATVTARGTSFDPIRASIDPGETVVWANESTGSYSSHTVTSAAFHDTAASWSFDETFEGGDSLSYTFESPGIYEYYCTIHGKSSMCGVILVGDVSLDKSLPCKSGSSGTETETETSTPTEKTGGY